MKFTADNRGDVLLVRAYTARELRVRDLTFTTSVILSAERHRADWLATSVESLAPEDFAVVLEFEPEVVLLGTGERQVFPDPRVFAHLAGRGIGFEVMDTGAACRTYNVLVSEGRRAVLAVVIAPC